MKTRTPTTPRQLVIIVSSLCVLFLFSWLVWQHLQPKPLAVLPNDVSQKLLFTPYVPSELPGGYILESPSPYNYKDGALFITARNSKKTASDPILISEQSAPKSFDVDGFYQNIIANPVRLGGTPSTTVYGARKSGTGTIVGITTKDNTWIIVSSPSTLKKDEIKRFVTGLIPQ